MEGSEQSSSNDRQGEQQNQSNLQKLRTIYSNTVVPFTDVLLDDPKKLFTDIPDNDASRTAAKIAKFPLKRIDEALAIAAIAEADDPGKEAAKIGTSIAAGATGAALATGAIALAPISVPTIVISAIAAAASIGGSYLSDALFERAFPPGTTIQEKLSRVKAVGQEFVDNLKEIWQDKVVDNYEAIRDGLSDQVDSLLDSAKGIRKDLLDTAKDIARTTQEKAQNFFDTIVDSFQDWVDGIGKPSPLGLPDNFPPPPPDDDGEGNSDIPPSDPPRLPPWLPFPLPNPFDFLLISPLVVDIDDDGVELISLPDSYTKFDLDSDGFSELTGWVDPDDALLAYDKNENGYIDNISELFGNETVDGFTELARLDENGDGTIDIKDPNFDQLLLWQDSNTNGVSEVGELTYVLSAGLLSIDLNADVVNKVNKGHRISHVSSTQWINGSSRTIEDVWFENDQMVSSLLVPKTFRISKQATALPNLVGYGIVPDLSYSLSTEPDLARSAKNLLKIVSKGNLSLFINEFESFLWEWTGVENVDPKEGGKYINGRHLAFIESFYGESFYSLHARNPGQRNGEGLEMQYRAAVDSMAARFLIQAEPNSSLARNKAQSLFSLGLLSVDINKDRVVGKLSAVVDAITTAIGKKNSSTGVADGGLLLRLLRSDFETGEQSYVEKVTAALQANDIFQDVVDVIQSIVISNSPIHGTDKSDFIEGSSTDDLFYISEGDDTLAGSYGSDTYLWGKGSGNDVIDEYGYYASLDTDTVLLTNLRQRDVTFSRSTKNGLDLIITSNRTGETLTLDEHLSSEKRGVEQVIFKDGTTWDRDDLLAEAWYRGTSGNDSITGISADETFDTGKGDDTLAGSYGSDTYLWGKGSGNDVIDEYGYYASLDTDTVLLTNLRQRDVTFSRSTKNGLDLIITSNRTGETLTLDEHLSSEKRGVEQVIFKDGTTWDRDDLLAEAWYRGTSGNDSITGTSADETFDTGKGDDTLAGSYGSDTYLWGKGSGNDVIDEYGYYASLDTDTVLLTDLRQRDVTFSRSTKNGLDLIITSNRTGETLTLDEHLSSEKRGVEQVIFKDGTTWDRDDLLAEAWYRGTSGNDSITGTSADETFDTGKGDDTLAGSYGSDTYLWGKGSGNDVIDEYGYYASLDTDTVLLTDLRQRDVTFSRSTKNGLDLIITSNRTGETLTLDEHLSSEKRGVEQVIFKDGTTWDRDDLLAEAWYRGTSGNDSITGTSADETFDAGKGDDVLTSGSRYDRDVMMFRNSFGHDLITDFIAGNSYGDVIRLQELSVSTFSEVLGFAKQVGKNTLIELDENSSIKLLGVNKANLQASNFEFL